MDQSGWWGVYQEMRAFDRVSLGVDGEFESVVELGN